VGHETVTAPVLAEREDRVDAASMMSFVARRRWAVIVPAVVLLAAALAYTLPQKRLFQGNAYVLISRENLASTVSGDPQVEYTSDEFFQVQQTQADLARSPLVAQRVLASVGGSGESVHELLARTDVAPDRSADFIVFEVRDPLPSRAQALSVAFAKQYVQYANQLDTASIAAAKANVDQSLAKLVPTAKNTTLIQSLTSKAQQLETLQALQTGNAQYVSTPVDVSQVQPRVIRNAVLGLILGLIVGVLVALLRDRVDTRVRSAEDIADALGYPLLGVLPAPARPGRDFVLMRDDPESPQAEAFRMLTHSLDYLNPGERTGILMVTSAVAGEGKSTTAANLAIAHTRLGRRVVLVDLDLRRPTIGPRFGLAEGYGLTDAVVGNATLAEVTTTVDLAGAQIVDGERPGRSRKMTGSKAELAVVPAGTIPPAPGEFLASAAVSEVIRQLKSDYDVVVLDTPPLLLVGDSLSLAPAVDGILLVSRLGIVRRPILKELARVLSQAPVPTLGFVVTGTGTWLRASGYGRSNRMYGYGEPTVRSTSHEVEVPAGTGTSSQVG
jgi:Mrp family chromosome partitioning ATPase/CheY-like chemotaxis protein